uniref:Uncharacterized protein n=1 Tax=Tanacetum cinerariifolium TaxID=118510 RepID=A0A699IY45_TANCI|nr:hypothetical protein [Tanacetum cinerariifolium]
MVRSVHNHRFLSFVAVKFGERENNEAWDTNCNHTRRRRSHVKIFRSEKDDSIIGMTVCDEDDEWMTHSHE